jgi:hypothetical protein
MLHDLGIKYHTDKAYLHNFCNDYEKLLRKDVKTLWEIGILDGASLRMWSEYYPNAKIIGYDIEDKSSLSFNDNVSVKLHLLKPYKDWSKYQPVEKDIDILFYGAMNGYRSYLLSKLSEKYHVCVLQGEWNRLDEFILRSKILLNIHFYYECALQEQARMIRWIGAPCRIISEKSKKNYLGVEEKTYEELLKL